MGGTEMNVFTTQIDQPADASALAMSGNDVFISYSRKDQSFVKTLDVAFQQIGRDPWVDWNDIQKGEEWWKAIQRGIEGANTFVFVLSPDSVASPICRQEIEYAALHHKRFLPIVHREGFDPALVHPSISSHNWLFFRETDDFNAAFEELIRAINTDLEYVRVHTRLLVRAIEWQAKNQNPSYLLRGDDLVDAETWLVQSASQEPRPTELQIRYLHVSRQVQAAKRSAKRKARRSVILTTILANLILSVGGGFWFYNVRTQEALGRIRNDMVNALHMGTIGTNGDDFKALATLSGRLPTNNPRYQTHQQWLLNVHSVFPNAFARTYISGGSGKIRWVGDISRSVQVGRRATDFLEFFDAEHGEDNVFNNQQTVVMRPYEDELGRWISASRPIKNANGQVVGGMRVDFRERYVVQVRQDVQRSLTIAYLLILVWLLISSWIIVRALPTSDE